MVKSAKNPPKTIPFRGKRYAHGVEGARESKAKMTKRACLGKAKYFRSEGWSSVCKRFGDRYYLYSR